MSRLVTLRRVARRDLEEAAEAIRRKRPRSALRFLRAARATVDRLLAAPEMGSPYESDHPELGDVRFSPVRGFRNHLVFYRPTPSGIEVLRVLHGVVCRGK